MSVNSRTSDPETTVWFLPCSWNSEAALHLLESAQAKGFVRVPSSSLYVFCRFKEGIQPRPPQCPVEGPL